MIKAKNHAKPFEESLRKLDEDNQIERYVFKPTDQIRSAFNNVLGYSASLPCQVSTISHETLGYEYQNITCLTATNYGMFVVGARVNNGQNTLGRMAIMDEKLKLQVKSKIKFQTIPYALTKTENDQIAATFPEEKTIRLMGYTPGTLSEERVIQVAGSCNGIAFCKGTLIVSFMQPTKIEIIDLKKRVVLKRYATGQLQQYLSPTPSNAFDTLQSPNYVSISPDGATLYVSEQNSVSSMTLEGEIKDTFNTGHGLTGVVFDDSGAPIVSGFYTHHLDFQHRRRKVQSVQTLTVSRLRNKNVELIFQENDSQHSGAGIAKPMAFNNNSLFVVTENHTIVIRFK